jgi:hypothetical protein
MAVSYLIFPSEDDAKARSRQGWRELLGRSKRHEDMTDFLWGWHVGKDGRTALVVDERRDLLTAAEKAASVDTLDANWDNVDLT